MRVLGEPSKRKPYCRAFTRRGGRIKEAMEGPVCFREGHKCSEEREGGGGGAVEYPPGSAQAVAQCLPSAGCSSAPISSPFPSLPGLKVFSVNRRQAVSTTDLPWDKGHTSQPAHIAWLI